MNIKDLKEAVGELMNEVSLQGLMNVADEIGDSNYDDHFFDDLSPIEQKVIVGLAQTGGHPKAQNISFEKLTRVVAGKVGATVHPMWPKHEALAADADGDVKFDPVTAKHYVCKIMAAGGDSDRIRHVRQGACPESWGVNPKNLSGTRGNWASTLSQSEKKVLNRVEAKVINGDYTDIDFADAVEEAATELGINASSLQFMSDTSSINRAKDWLGKKLEDAGETRLKEAKSKKRGFGEGDPPDEEIYKKREVVQEIDAETPDAAKSLGDASKEQGEATMGVADAHTRGAEAAKQRQDASAAWKDAKITQVKAVDAAEKQAAEEAKAATKAAQQQGIATNSDTKPSVAPEDNAPDDSEDYDSDLGF